MNVFVLSPGRSGTMTFALACTFISNFSVGHESLDKRLGPARWAYPPNHIEVSLRLAWRLGTLDKHFPDALYVHLVRDPELVAQSFAKHRFGHGRASIMEGWQGISFKKARSYEERLESAREYVRAVNDNIECFLATRKACTICLDERGFSFGAFDHFWFCEAGAKGDYQAACNALDERHHADGDVSRDQPRSEFLWAPDGL